MPVRKWVIRCFVVSILLIAGASYYLFERWTNPQIVRELVLNHLTSQLIHTDIRLASAEVKLFGGIGLFDLRLGRRTTPPEESFAVFPEITVFPNKEKLAQGQLEIRKIHIKRPKFHVIRFADGTWNLGPLFEPQRDMKCAWPAIELRSGTVTFVDEQAQAPPMLLHDVRIDLVPDLPTHGKIIFEARADRIGKLRMQGIINLVTGAMETSLEAPEVLLKPELFEWISLYFPQWKTWQVQLTGKTHLNGSAAYHPGEAKPISFNIHGQLNEGIVQHKQWPFPIEQIQAFFHVSGGKLEVHQFTAKMQEGNASGSGSLNLDGSMHLKGAIENVFITSAIYDKLPPILCELAHEFKPHGRLNAQGEILWRDNHLGLNYVAKPQGMSILFDDFPYPFQNVRGTLAYSEPPTGPVMLANITAQAGEQPVRLTGQLYGVGLRPDSPCRSGFHITLQGENVPIDQHLHQALAPYPDTLHWLKQFNLEGRVSCLAVIERAEGTTPHIRPPLKKTIRVAGHELNLRFNDFPVHCQHGQGILKIHPDGSWSVEQFKAFHDGGWIQAAGVAVPTTLGDQLKMILKATDLPLDEELRQALPRVAREGWEHFNPAGRIDAEVSLDVVLGQTQPRLDVIISPKGCTIKPECFPYQLDQVEGTIRYKDNSLTIHQFKARHGPTLISMEEGRVTLRENQCFRAELTSLRAEQIVYDRDLMQALPALLRGAMQSLQPGRPFNLTTNLIIEDPGQAGPTQFGWNGFVELNQCPLHIGLDLDEVSGRVSLRGTHDGEKIQAWGKLELDELRIKGQPFRQVQGDLTILEDRIWIQPLRCQIHKGLCTGRIEVDMGSKSSYLIHLKASRVDMETLARQSLHRRGKVQGLLDAELRLTGSGQSLRGLQGQGWVKVEEGAHLYDMPLILDLLNYLSRHLPKGSSFQDLTAEFQIDGERIQLNRLVLMSDAITLQGKGEVKLDGKDLNLEMYGLPYGRNLPLLPPIIDRIPPTISKQLMKIRIKGQISNVEILTEPLPVVIEPIMDMLRTMTERHPSKNTQRPRPLSPP